MTQRIANRPGSGGASLAENLYTTYHIDRHDERAELFRIVAGELHAASGMYPGCFVHVTPSFFIPRMVYIDTDRRAEKFFTQGEAAALIRRRKAYAGAPEFEFYRQDFTDPAPAQDATLDVLVSQYAGFVGKHCKRYLRSGGLLVANNSHGDAGLAACDPDYELVAVVTRRGETFRLSVTGLTEYFVPKSRRVPQTRTELRTYLTGLGRGIGYRKSAADYVFRKR